MTENEAIEILNENIRQAKVIIENPTTFYSEKQIVDGLKHMNDCLNAYQIGKAALEEIQQYRLLGAVEECRDAMEKQKAKKPVKDEYNHKCCPRCGWIVYKDEFDGRYLPHCENCGQAIDWSDTE